MPACEAAKGVVEAFYKGRHGKTIYTNIETRCVEFANIRDGAVRPVASKLQAKSPLTLPTADPKL